MDQLLVTIGTFLGRLPLQSDPQQQPVQVPVLRQNLQLRRVGENLEAALSFLQRPRFAEEFEAWAKEQGVDAPGLVEELIREEFIVAFDPRGGEIDLAAFRGRASGGSLGVPEEEYLLLTPDDEVVSVAPISYWCWVFADLGASLAQVASYISTEVFPGAEVDVEGEIRSSLAFLLYGRLLTLDRAADAPE